MASTPLTPQTLDRSGLTDTLAAANADGHTLVNDQRTFIHVKNTGASPCNVTIVTTVTEDGLALADRIVTVPITTGDKMIGPFSTSIYGNPITITFDQVVSVTISAIKMAAA